MFSRVKRFFHKIIIINFYFELVRLSSNMNPCSRGTHNFNPIISLQDHTLLCWLAKSCWVHPAATWDTNANKQTTHKCLLPSVCTIEVCMWGWFFTNKHMRSNWSGWIKSDLSDSSVPCYFAMCVHTNISLEGGSIFTKQSCRCSRFNVRDCYSDVFFQRNRIPQYEINHKPCWFSTHTSGNTHFVKTLFKYPF